jgi:hypothetical protein
MDSFELISKRELDQLHLYRKRFFAGWGVAIAVAMLAVFTYSRWQSLESALGVIKYQQAELVKVQQQQRELAGSLTEALETQKASVDAIKSVGEYLSDKDNIVDKNRGMVKR